jgi:hypothetical protein
MSWRSGEEMSVAYCDTSHWLLFSSLVLTIVALVLALSAKASIASSRGRISGLLPLDPLKSSIQILLS